MSHEQRLSQITAAMQAMQIGWPFIAHEINLLIEGHTMSLIGQNNEEVRGRIKALRDLLNLPESLDQERQGIAAAELPDPDSAL